MERLDIQEVCRHRHNSFSSGSSSGRGTSARGTCEGAGSCIGVVLQSWLVGYRESPHPMQPEKAALDFGTHLSLARVST
ncbi:hypothetical protein ECG_03918 [Echinococcus granulosus]|uniref:Uncharacterized protein n=1 Tax=Echinococcus granulosus TaxID=6210 RepID=A0A068WDL8_ECHGR|nr:hypothetical protein ECG_03918 [Echinococcus granulosus]CDS17815.1 hypothetical protein EgrG_001058300 [Echinococcus granulosus]